MLNSRKEIEVYMPHSGDMVLIDRVLDHGSEHIVTELDIDSRLPCYVDEQVPAYFGIEVMAQSIAAWSGIRRNNPNSKPPVGLLLGTRRYECALNYFSVGSVLKIRSQRVLENEGLAVFSCEMDVTSDKTVQTNVAKANISVYSAPE